MSNQEFVKAIYINAFGYAGDSSGIDYWSNLLNDYMSRSDMVASFVHNALNINLSEHQWNPLTAEERESAQNRQDTLTNKANAGIYFAETLGEESNITNFDDLDSDPAYLASITTLENIDNTPDSLVKSKIITDKLLINTSPISADTLTTAGTINIGSTQTGTIEIVFDEDWFAVLLTAGTSYLFSAASNPLETTYLNLYNPQGNSTYQSDHQGYDEAAATIWFTPDTSGTYYLAISDLGGDSTGSYSVSVELTGLSDDYSNSL